MERHDREEWTIESKRVSIRSSRDPGRVKGIRPRETEGPIPSL